MPEDLQRRPAAPGAQPAERRTMAVVHEWLDSFAGSEKVFIALAQIFPGADRFALTAEPAMRAVLAERGLDLTTTWLDNRLTRDRREVALPLMPLAWRTLAPGADYEVVVTSHHAFAQSNRLGRRAHTHLVYVHTPARYLWTPELDGRGNTFAARCARAPLRLVDARAARRVTSFAANSSAVRDRVRTAYGRDAVVIHPPVDTTFYYPGQADNGLDIKDGYLLSVGRFISYKRHDLAIRLAAAADLPVVLAGHGPEEHRLRALASSLGVRARFCIRPSDEQLRAIYQGAVALVFLGIEDFGIVPVEAQACGTPVIGLDVGGTRDTVLPDVSGEQVRRDAGLDDLRRAVQACRELPRQAVARSADRFAPAVFERKVRDWVAASSH